jgi:hypothetical protein
MLDVGPQTGPFSEVTWLRLGSASIIVALLALVIGCGVEGENGASTKNDHVEEARQRSRPAADVPGSQSPRRSKSPSTLGADPRPDPRRENVDQSIPGMNAATAVAIIQKPGLECWQPVDKSVLYACSSEEQSGLRYEAEIAGTSVGQVSGVKVWVYRQGAKDFDVASWPFLGLLSTQLRYRQSDAGRAYEFVHRNLSSKKATSAIGAARWTIKASHDTKVLTVTCALQAEADSQSHGQA